MNIWTKNTATTLTKTFVDANILLEIIQKRKHFDEVIEFVRKNSGSLYISPLTVHLTMYFGLHTHSISAIQALLSDYYVLPMNSQDVSWAFNNLQGKDFEDALQLACAVNSECDNFVTLDQSLIKRYEKQAPINFISP